MFRFLKIFLARAFFLAVVVYLTAAVMIYFRQDHLLFHPKPIPKSFDLEIFKDLQYTVHNEGANLQGWLFEFTHITANAPLVIYYGGNAEEMSQLLDNRHNWSAGALLLMNYRGYGDSEGKPSAKLLKNDALAIFDQLIEAENIDSRHIVLVGRSLGSGIATYVASKRKIQKIILVTPLDSMQNIAKFHYPWLPVAQLLTHRFDSLSLAPQIKTPLLTLIASHDTVIPQQFSENLIQAWGGETQTVYIADSNHASINSQNDYWQAIQTFIQQ